MLAVALATTAAFAARSSPTTLSRTVRDIDNDNRLERAPGQRRVVRQDLARAKAGRSSRRRQRFFFGQLSDFQTTDEESPLRGEFVDQFDAPFQDFYRINQGLSTQVVEAMARRMRAARSPVNGSRPRLVMTTGDNADNTHFNETRWVIDLLDGGKRIRPNSGERGTCGVPDDGHVYDGSRGDNLYYEPDRSGPGVDGPGYSPNEAENMAERDRSSSVRDFPGLLEAQNRSFRSTGLGIPWYSIFGNHDSLLTGNFQRSQAVADYARGCVKVTGISPEALGAAAPLVGGGITPQEQGQIAQIFIDDVLRTASDPARFSDRARIVPRDPKRLPLKKSRFISEHFRTAGRPDGHGFTRANIRSGEGNYSFRPRRGLRFLVLDSVSDSGGSAGNIGDRQFRWIHSQLLRADRRRELVMAFSHHSLRTMNQPVPSGFPPGDQEGDKGSNVHFGTGPDNTTSSCPTRGARARTRRGETLRCLFLRHRSLIAFVNGHEHENRITPVRRRGAAGFWQITTASHIDWPQESRLIDLFDNRDGTLSIFGTILDHAGNANPGSSPLNTTGPQSRAQVSRLASISRELACNDPNSNSGAGGPCASSTAGPLSEGARSDRNVELILRNPFRARRTRVPRLTG
ncbi:MAG TPA: TIGR03767 family metallophosphoesterase [Thermoleophilaceae bacterium]|nr:TIGR03767 family metallophosphoesterase [Thermoleophilaceae bacterium]